MLSNTHTLVHSEGEWMYVYIVYLFLLHKWQNVYQKQVCINILQTTISWFQSHTYMLLDFFSNLRSLTIGFCVFNILVHTFFLNQCRKDIIIQNGIYPQLDACYIICINDFLLEFFCVFHLQLLVCEHNI